MDENNIDGDGVGRESGPTRQEQIAWAAGLWEGEGCWNAYTSRGRLQVQARMTMTDEDVVLRFSEIVGFGTVVPRKVAKSHYKPATEWYTQRRANVRELIQMFKPYLGERRLARAEDLLALGESHPLNERTHCPNGHAYEGDNLILEPIVRAGRKYFARRCKICRTEQARARARKRLGVSPDRYRV